MADNQPTSPTPNTRPCPADGFESQTLLLGLLAGYIRITDPDVLAAEARVHGDRWLTPLLVDLVVMRDRFPDLWTRFLDVDGDQAIRQITHAVDQATEQR